jgi:hypothetical protein
MPGAPRRPNYFTGQLLTEEDFEAEQSYFLDGRRSDTRHLHGWGVVCGLGVAPSGGGVAIQPGLAIDGLGREIVVPEPREMPDPHQPIDDRGESRGEPVDSDTVTICLAYAERPEGGDPARFVRETYTLEVRPGAPKPPARSAAADAALTGSAGEVARALCEATAGEACDPMDECVPLATVSWRRGRPRVAQCPRRTVASTDALLELILGLVERVRALEQRN